jgi:hypothetical protein
MNRESRTVLGPMSTDFIRRMKLHVFLMFLMVLRRLLNVMYGHGLREHSRAKRWERPPPHVVAYVGISVSVSVSAKCEGLTTSGPIATFGLLVRGEEGRTKPEARTF